MGTREAVGTEDAGREKLTVTVKYLGILSINVVDDEQLHTNPQSCTQRRPKPPQMSTLRAREKDIAYRLP